MDQSALMRFGQLFLATANEDHGAVQTQEAIFAGLVSCHDSTSQGREKRPRSEPSWIRESLVGARIRWAMTKIGLADDLQRGTAMASQEMNVTPMETCFGTRLPWSSEGIFSAHCEPRRW
jgi:hypothetical protein